MPRPTEIAGKAVGKMKGAKQVLTGGAGIFKRLADEHGQIAVMLRRIAASREGSSIRRELFPQVRLELLAHSKAEEKEIYPIFRSLHGVGSKMDQNVVDHEGIERLLAQLHLMHMGDERWIEVFRELVHAVHRHVLEEEHTIFPIAKEVLTRAQSQALEERYDLAKRAALDAHHMM